MQVTASWGGEPVAVEVDAECRSVEGLKRCLQEALPEVDVEAVRLEVCGRPVDDEAVLGLVAGSVIDVSASQAALAAAALREEGCAVNFEGFCFAAEIDDVRLCKLYLEAGIVWPPGSRNPLHIAARCGHIELCELFLASGCDKDAADAGGITPLHFAVSKENSEVAKLLLDSGCARDVKDNDEGNTPLHWAITYNVQMAELLVDSGCARDVKNNAGDTPLHYAAWQGCAPVCKLLLDAGWAKSDKNDRGDMPLHLAIMESHTPVVDLLLDSGCERDERANRLLRVCAAEPEAVTGHCVLC